MIAHIYRYCVLYQWVFRADPVPQLMMALSSQSLALACRSDQAKAQ